MMRQLLKKHGLPVGQGWDKTLKILYTLHEKQGKDVKKINVLEEAYFEYLLCGERAVKLYKIEDEKLKQLIAAIQNYEPEDSIFAESFPYPLSNERLAEADNTTALIYIYEDTSFINIVFCTKRFITERRELSLDELSIEAQNDLCAYDEIIAVKHNMKQCFDVVTVCKDDGFIEIRIDLNGGISSDDISLASANISKVFRNLCSELVGEELIGGIPINFFPLIDRMYEAPEGRVCELGFTTDTASIKHEKMRKKDICLRSEDYHRAGKEAVHHITPYRLGVCWTMEIAEGIESKPELLLPGNFRILGRPEQYLGEAVINNCCGLDDYHFVIRKLKNYING